MLGSPESRAAARASRANRSGGLVFDVWLREHLDGDDAAERRVRCAIDVAHRAARDSLDLSIARWKYLGHRFHRPTVLVTRAVCEGIAWKSGFRKEGKTCASLKAAS